MFRMKLLRSGLKPLVFAVLAGAAAGGLAQAQAPAGTPSIMAPEPGARPQVRSRPRPPEPSLQTEAKPAVPTRRARGASSPSPLPRYQSPPAPDFSVRRSIDGPQLTSPPAVPRPVPGYATVPPPPTSLSGQSFGDRAVGCAHHGAASGIGAGQIGAYSGSCVNSR